jgi:endonuclease/exonuclease/phosphatase family metal-dependent hydrolase
LGLFSFHRKQQYKWIVEYTKKNIPDESPLIIAGDLNDWTHRAERLLAEPLGLKEAFLETQGHLAKSFPVFCPILTLDRIYYRGLHIRSSEVLSFSPWRGLSDHAALMAEFDL